ncbi:MAG: 5'-methylthioadenosine/S-adenosylhomocysteine nucleosidase [Pseudomonadota bacterium]
MPKIVILSSALQEITPFYKHITDLNTIERKNIEFRHGLFGQHEIILGVTGVGMVNSAAISALAIEWFRPDLLIFCGVAGGMSSEIKIGDVVIATEVAEPEFLTIYSKFADTPFEHTLIHPHKQIMQPAWFPSTSFPDISKPNDKYDVHSGRIASSDQFPAPKEEYSLLLREHVLAIDMETAAMYQAGWITNVPTLAVRGISNCLLKDGSDPEMSEANVNEAPQRATDVCLDLIEQF